MMEIGSGVEAAQRSRGWGGFYPILFRSAQPHSLDRFERILYKDRCNLESCCAPRSPSLKMLPQVGPEFK